MPGAVPGADSAAESQADQDPVPALTPAAHSGGRQMTTRYRNADVLIT